MILLLESIYVLLERNVENIRNWDGETYRKLSMEINHLFLQDAEDGSADSMQPVESEIIAFQRKLDTGYILARSHLCDILATNHFPLAYTPKYWVG